MSDARRSRVRSARRTQRDSIRKTASEQCRPVATTPYPFLESMIKLTVLCMAAVVLFGAGIWTGWLAVFVWPAKQSFLKQDQHLETRVLEKLKSELKLDPSQVARVTPIVNAACNDFRMLAEERKARRLEILDEISTTIAPDLNSDQQKRLEALEEEWRLHRSQKDSQRVVALF